MLIISLNLETVDPSSSINIGNLDYLEVKLDNLLAFYEKIIKFKGWNYYTSLNLKYHDQIICTKK